MSIEIFLTPGDWLGTGRGPRYILLRRRLAEAIEQGVLAPGEPLPSEREAARITGTSRVTVRKAIEDLARAGRVVQVQGSGSFVADKDGAAPGTAPSGNATGRLASISEDFALRGVATTVETLDVGIFPATPDDIAALGLSPEAQVIRLVRLRSAGGTPIGIEATTLPADVLKKPEKVGASLYAALEKGGFRPARAIQRVAAAGLSKKDAKQLGVKKGDPALAVRRVGYLAGGRAVEVTEALYLADRYDMIAELRG
jgi:GntR family transcriptional regulator